MLKRSIGKEISDLFRAKRRRRKALAKLPIGEKIAILIRLQRMAYEVGVAAGRIPRRPWRMDR